MAVSSKSSVTKLFLSILFILLVVKAHSQDNATTRKKIDSLINSTDLFSRNSRMLESQGKRIQAAAQKAAYPKGLIYGNLLLARYLYLTDHYAKSISFLEQAEKQKKYLQSAPWLQAYVYYLYSQNYLFVGLRMPAKQNLQKALQWVAREKPNSPRKEKLTARIYQKFMGQSIRLMELDSVRYYINKYEDLPVEYTEPNQAYANIMRGKIHLINEELDAAYHDYMKGYKQINNKETHSYPIALLDLGRIAYQRKNYNKGLQYFLEGLQHAHFPPIKIAFYKYLTDSYAKLGNPQKEYYYLERYTTAQDSFQTINRTRHAAMFKHYSESQKNNNQVAPISNRKAATILLIILTIAAGGFFFFYRRKNKKLAILSQQRSSPKQRKQDKFEKVVELAKNNDPSFLTRFRDVYPEVFQKITALEPAITRSEQTLCAMIWLNFNTKDIARYTHIQPKSVRMKKYRLRKKMDLPKGKDLYEWMKNL